MSGVPSLQPRWCDECGQPEMAWVVSATDTNKEQNADKDIDSQTGTANAVIGNEVKTSAKEEKSKALEESKGGLKPTHICTDPTCDNHIDALSDIILWKLRYASDREYSDEEAQEIVEEAAEQSIRDYQTVTETVEEMSDAKVTQNTQVEETPSQQLGRCGCGKQQESTQRSVGKTATEQESVTNTTRVMQSVKASVSAIPLVNVEVGGKTQRDDETTNTEISTFNTIDTGVFPICPDRGCEEHLKMMGMIESWKMRNDSIREYSDEEVDEKLMNVIAQEINNDKITTEAVENVREEMLGNELDQRGGIEASDSLTDSGDRSADTEAAAAFAVTDSLYEQLDGIEPADEGSTVQPDVLDDKIAAIGTEFTRIEDGVAELEANPNTQIKSGAKQQQLLDQLEAMTGSVESLDGSGMDR